MNGFRIVAKNDAATIWLYDEIGPFGVTAKAFIDEMQAVPSDMPITLRINSPGGDAFDGISIYNNLKRRKNVHIEVDGAAASAAAIIAMAGDTVVMAENALMMIHQAWGLAIGSSDELMKRATMLESIDAQQLKIFGEKTGLPDEEVMAMIKAETWMDSAKAAELGFIDKVVGEQRIAASAIRRDFTRDVPKSSIHFDPEPLKSIGTDFDLKIRIAEAELDFRRDERGNIIPTDDGTGLQVEK